MVCLRGSGPRFRSASKGARLRLITLDPFRKKSTDLTPSATRVSKRCSPVTISLAIGWIVTIDGSSPSSFILPTAALPSARAAASSGGGASGCSGTRRDSDSRPSAFWLPSEIFRTSLYVPG